MKAYLLFIISFLSFFMFGCSSEEDSIQQQDPDDAYYVKYEVYMPLGTGFQLPFSKDIRFVSDKGEQIITTTHDSWEGTYGPLKKGTELYLEVEAEGGVRNNIEYYIRLSVSKNKEPFVLKGEQREESVSSLYTSYTIDY